MRHDPPVRPRGACGVSETSFRRLLRFIGLALLFVAFYIAYSIAGWAGTGVAFLAAIGSLIHSEATR